MSVSCVGYPFTTAHVVRPEYVFLQISEVVGNVGAGVVVVGAGVVVVVVVVRGRMPFTPYRPKHSVPLGALTPKQ
jgi:hypothetical protein